MIFFINPSISASAMGAIDNLTGRYSPAWTIFRIASVIITVCLISVGIYCCNSGKIALELKIFICLEDLWITYNLKTPT